MVKKVTTLFMCLLLIIIPCVSLAAESGSIVGEVAVDTAKQTISFSGRSTTGQFKTVYVLLQNEEGNVVFADFFETDIYGKYEYEFVLNESGNFNLSVRISGEEVQTRYIENYVALQEACSIIKRMLSTTDAEIIASEAEELKIDGCEFVKDFSADEKASLVETLLNSGFTSQDFDVDSDSQKAAESYKELTSIISKQLIAGGLRNSDSAEMYQEIFKNYKAYFPFVDLDKYYGGMSGSDKKTIYGYMYSERVKIVDIESLNDSFGRAVFMTEFNKLTKKDDFGNIINEYSGLFDKGLISEYNGLSVDKKSDTNAYMINNRGQITAFSGIAEYLEKAMKESGNSDSGTKHAGTGGGGGSSASGYVTADSNANTNTNTNTNINANEDKQITMNNFDDVDDSFWAAENIRHLKELGVIDGKGDGKFYPNDMLTREEFAAILCKAFNLETSAVGKCSADDVTYGTWYYGYVAKCYKDGIVNGMTENSFGIGCNISRQDAAVMLDRCISKYNFKLSATADVVSLNDINEISEYARSSVEKMCAAGIIKGDENGNFRANDYISRAETARLISELLRKIES